MNVPAIANLLFPMNTTQWIDHPETRHCAALSTWEDYVVSHHFRLYCARYRATGQHIVIGDFLILDEAKAACKTHSQQS